MIRLNNVTKRFPGHDTASIDQLNLSIHSGEFCVLLGMNGCGKSTLLKIIRGLVQPDDGYVETHAGIAEVVQDVSQGVVSDLSLLENIALSGMHKPCLMAYRRFRSEVIAKLTTLKMGLEGYIDQPISCLSGGQRQAVATLMALSSNKPIVLLDEHTAALDVVMQNKLMQYTAEQVAEQSLTAVMVTHKLVDAITYGDRLIIMHKGKIVEDIQRARKQSLRLDMLTHLFYELEQSCLS